MDRAEQLALAKRAAEKRMEWLRGMAEYVKTHRDYARLSKRQVVAETLAVLLNDIGAAQSFLDVIGVPYDLYESQPTNTKENQCS